MKASPNLIRGFNPCFDGSVARGVPIQSRPGRSIRGFNPCFDGSVARGEV